AADGRTLLVGVRGAAPAALLDVARRARHMFDLDADPRAVAAALAGSPHLARTVRARAGLRVPGVWDRFEAVVRAIVGQQPSAAAQLGRPGAGPWPGRPADRFGPAFAGGPARGRLFPPPAALAAAAVAAVGLPRARADSLRRVAAAVAADPTLLDCAPSLDD